MVFNQVESPRRCAGALIIAQCLVGPLERQQHVLARVHIDGVKVRQDALVVRLRDRARTSKRSGMNSDGIEPA